MKPCLWHGVSLPPAYVEFLLCLDYSDSDRTEVRPLSFTRTLMDSWLSVKYWFHVGFMWISCGFHVGFMWVSCGFHGFHGFFHVGVGFMGFRGHVGFM